MASSRIRRRRPTATWDEVRGGWNRGAGVGILFVEQREEATEVSAPLAHRAALPRLAAMDYSARRRRLKVRAEAMMILGCSDGGLGVSLQACDGNDERHRKHRLGSHHSFRFRQYSRQSCILDWSDQFVIQKCKGWK